MAPNNFAQGCGEIESISCNFSVKVELELLLFGSSVPVPSKLELVPEFTTSSSVT